MKLPRTKGQSEIVWTDGEGGRLRVECHGNAWALYSEYAPEDDGNCEVVMLHGGGCECGDCPEEPEDAEPMGVIPAAYSAVLTKLALALREVADMTVVQFMDVFAKGSTKMPGSKPVRVARAKGWWVELSLCGDTHLGEPLIGVEFKRPLSAEEFVVFLRRMAVWLDARDNG